MGLALVMLALNGNLVCRAFIYLFFFFLILCLANNTHYITVDNRKKNGKERQIPIKPGSYTIGWDYKLQKHGMRFTLL